MKILKQASKRYLLKWNKMFTRSSWKKDRNLSQSLKDHGQISISGTTDDEKWVHILDYFPDGVESLEIHAVYLYWYPHCYLTSCNS